MKSLPDILRERVLVLDGPIDTPVQAHDLSVEIGYCGGKNCAEMLVLRPPGGVEPVMLAEYRHQAMREELDIHGNDTPTVRDQFTQKHRGSLTETGQIDPGQSTCPWGIPHPNAKYFNV